MQISTMHFSPLFKSARTIGCSVWFLLGSLVFLLLQIGTLQRSIFLERSTRYSKASNHYHEDSEGDEDSVWVQMTASLEYESDLIPHTIDHYVNKLGADPNFVLLALHHTDYSSKENNATDHLFEEVEMKYRKEYGLRHFYRWGGTYDSNRLWETRQTHRALVNLQPCDWIVRSDADEFPDIPGNDLRQFLKNVGVQGYDSVFGKFNDRVALEGVLTNISSAPPSLSEQFPLSCNLTEAIAGGDVLKAVAFRGYHKENRGGHHLLQTSRQAPEFRKEIGSDHCGYPPVIRINHYKWISSVFQKILTRYERYKELNMGHYVQSERLIGHIQKHNGRIGVDDLNCTMMNSLTTRTLINYETIYVDGVSCQSLNQTCH